MPAFPFPVLQVQNTAPESFPGPSVLTLVFIRVLSIASSWGDPLPTLWQGQLCAWISPASFKQHHTSFTYIYQWESSWSPKILFQCHLLPSCSEWHNYSGFCLFKWLLCKWHETSHSSYCFYPVLANILVLFPLLWWTNLSSCLGLDESRFHPLSDVSHSYDMAFCVAPPFCSVALRPQLVSERIARPYIFPLKKDLPYFCRWLPLKLSQRILRDRLGTTSIYSPTYGMHSGKGQGVKNDVTKGLSDLYESKWIEMLLRWLHRKLGILTAPPPLVGVLVERQTRKYTCSEWNVPCGHMCFNTWSPEGGTVSGCCGTFWTWGLTGGSRT